MNVMLCAVVLEGFYDSLSHTINHATIQLQCAYCGETICSECSSQKVIIPTATDKRQQRVCDACYGVLQGMVGEDIPLITALD